MKRSIVVHLARRPLDPPKERQQRPRVKRQGYRFPEEGAIEQLFREARRIR